MVQDEYSYFLTALNIYYKYNVTVSSKKAEFTSYHKLDFFFPFRLQPRFCVSISVSTITNHLLLNKILLQRVLSDAGYVPSNTEKYPLGGIIAAIQTAFHINPEVMCVERSVQEIRLCFHKDFKVFLYFISFAAFSFYSELASPGSVLKTMS